MFKMIAELNLAARKSMPKQLAVALLVVFSLLLTFGCPGGGGSDDDDDDGGAEDEDGAGERSGGEDGVDVAELAEWIVAELSPEELAVFVADLAAAVEEFAGTPAGADMAALLAEFE